MPETPEHDAAPVAEAKEATKPPSAPLRLMTQFLRAVSESRMEDALALAQTILTFEPRNPIILDYQATLAEYINNDRALQASQEEEEEDGEESSMEESSNSSNDEDAEPDKSSTDEPSGDETLSPGHDEAKLLDEGSDGAHDRACSLHERAPSRTGPVQDEQEEQRLGRMIRDLRETRLAGSQEAASRWDEEKFAASRREVEAVLWKFLPEGARQAAEKRAEDDTPAPNDHT